MPGAADVVAGILARRLGNDRVRVEAADQAPVVASDPDVMERVRRALTLRRYSPRTRKAYLGHIRRFLERYGTDDAGVPGAVEASLRAYLLELVEVRGASVSYQNQVVSALRFMCESVLGQPTLAVRIPRPRKERQLPEVLSPGEVARILARARNPKHRALLMLLYSAGLRVGEVVRLRPSDLDVKRGSSGFEGERAGRTATACSRNARWTRSESTSRPIRPRHGSSPDLARSGI